MKKVKTFFVLMAVLFINPVNSQNSCGQSVATEIFFNQHPELKQEYIKNISKADEVSNNIMRYEAVSAAANYTIPMVFHVLHMGGAENISDAQIIDQVALLNRDYQKKNADTSLIVPSFTNNIANVGIAFALATLDPDGNCTDGIIRHYTSKTNWNANDLNEFIYSWPRDKYLNVYIVRSINIPATAYAFLPPTGVPPMADCIVCIHNNCGSIGTSSPAFSRVLTHEVGHWFNLQHIWGTSNQPGVICGDDAVNDTPITKGFSHCNTLNTIICTPGIEENIQNYMDYSPCKIMFTNGQATRMLNCLNGTLNNRVNLSSPSNLLATGITFPGTHCLPMVEIATQPSNTICLGSTLPMYSYTSNAQVTTYSWTANNSALINSASSASTSITFNALGNSTIECKASNINGSATSSMVVTVVDNVAQNSGSAAESFEASTLPVNWSILNPATPAASWDIINGVSSHGGQCIFVNGEGTPGGSIEILQSPSYDFLNNPGSSFTFKYAYAQNTANHKDVFKVQASYDCGGTFKDIYAPSAQAMSSGSGGVTNTLFFPSPTQWKTYDITQHPNFVSFLNKSNVIFRFYFKEDSAGMGNRFYLDQINMDSPVGLNELSKSVNLFVYPNPAKEEFNVRFSLNEPKRVKLVMHDIQGSLVYEQESFDAGVGTHDLEIKNRNVLNKGVYFLNLELDNLKIIKKLVII